MFLDDLQENKMSKLKTALNEVFDLNFNFDMDTDKLVKIQETTENRIMSLRDSGVDVTNKDFQKLLLIQEGINMVLREVAPKRQGKKMKVKESHDLDQAEVLLAAKQMADDLQKMAENLASMQVEDLMSITNAMKEEVGTAEAEAFSQSAEAAISSALEAVKQANDQVSNAVMVAQGEHVEDSMDSLDTGFDSEFDAGEVPSADFGDELGDEFGAEEGEFGDDFEASDAASGEDTPLGRGMKEDAYLSAMKMIKEAQQDGKVSKAMLKQAFAHLRNK